MFYCDDIKIVILTIIKIESNSLDNFSCLS